MAIEIPTTYAQVTYVFRSEFQNRDWATVLGANTGTDVVEDVAAVYAAAWTDTLQLEQDNSITLAAVVVRMGPTGGPTPGPTLEFPVGVDGALSLAAPPPNTATLVKKNTALGGRANRGRNFWPGFLAATHVDETGKIDAGRLSDLDGVFADWFSRLVDADNPLVLLHDESSPSTVPTLVTSIAVDPLVATQRRRLRS